MQRWLMMVCVCCAFDVAAACGGAEGAQARVARFLAQAGDPEEHRRFWADDLIYTSSSGRRFGKAALLAGLAEPDPDGEAEPLWHGEDYTVRIEGPVAVITFRLIGERESQRVGEYFNTAVMRCTPAGWQALIWAVTRVGE